MLVVLERSKVMSMVVSVLKLWVVVMMLLPVMFTSVMWEVSRDWSSCTLLSGSRKLIVAVIMFLAVIKSGKY